MAQASESKPFAARYRVSTSSYDVGQATLSLAPAQDGWLMELSTKPEGVFSLIDTAYVRETSLLSVDTAQQQPGLLPRTYRYFEGRDSTRHKLQARFMHDEDRIAVSTAEGEVSSLSSLSAGVTYDHLSSLLEVMRRLRSGVRGNLELHIFSKDKVSTHRLAVGRTEDIQTQAGNYPAILITQVKKNSSRKTLTWYAESLDYLPVKIERYKGDELIARLLLQTYQHPQP